MQYLKEQLQSLVDLNEVECAHFIRQLTRKKYKRHELLLREGEVCKHVFFIVSGMTRYFYTNESGVEQTGQFFFETSWYTDYDSFLTGKPSDQSVQALEKSELLLLPKPLLYRLYDENPKFERFGRLMAEQAFLGVRQRNNSLLLESPEVRYLNLIQQRPKVIDRVPLHYIASYLGIKPESLSRIRRRLFENRSKS